MCDCCRFCRSKHYNDDSKSQFLEKLPKLSHYSSVSEIHRSFYSYLTENFQRKECLKFEAGPQQTNCVCGGTLKEHSLQNYADNTLPPGTLEKASVQNSPSEGRVRAFPTNACGEIEFQIDGLGLLKPSKYLRLADDSNMDSLVHLLQNYWKMNEPSSPEFLISITGNASSFVGDAKWKEEFTSSLVKAVFTGHAWLLTGGLNFGIVKVIGDAVRKKQSLVSANDRMIHAIRCIGVAKWGCVENSELLINSDPKMTNYARYKVKPHHKIESGRAFLNPGHTHFLLVDDGTKRMCKGVEMFRVELMRKLSATKDEGLEIPAMLLVIGGDLDSIDEILLCLQKDIPVLLCCGSGDIADIIATAISCASASQFKCERIVADENKDLIRNMLNINYKKQLKNSSQLLESRVRDIYNCCKKKHLIHIYEISGGESLDTEILHTVMKHKKDATLQDQLLLAVKWDRPDVAKKVFPDCGSWPLDIMEQAMTTALVTNKPAFVKLFLKRGIVMRDYLTVGLLRKLYNECIPENEAALALLKDLTHKERYFNLRDISLFLSSLLRKHRDELYMRDITCRRGNEPTGISAERFEQPFRELFIWAIIVLRTEMALLFWNETQKPLQMAIVATAIYWRINACYENEETSVYLSNKKEFENIALGVLKECDMMDWKKTSEILNYRDQYWGNMTVLDLAVMAYDRAFMASTTCIKVTEQLWFGKLENNTIVRLSFTIFNPLLIGLGYIRFRSDPDQKREPNIFEKIYYFYSCPAIKMIVLFYSYMCYLVLFSYIILFDFRDVMNWPEVILHVWVFSLILDIGKEIVQQPSDSKDSKFVEWFHGYFWNKLDVVWIILFAFGITLRLTSQFVDISYTLRLDDIHLIYTFSCLLSYIRLYEFYMTMSHIGPKLIVLKRMIGDLIVFFLIVAVCILCYGIGRVALLHRERQPFWYVLKEIVSLPYWHLFGELDVGEYGGGYFPKCEANPSSCYQSRHSWIVPIMLGVYMLIGNILLVNMLIAVFTHIFDEVNTNSREIYLFEIYISGQQFSRRSVLIPPFLIIEDILYVAYVISRKLYQKLYAQCCCFKKGCDEKCQMQERLYRAYVENLRLFEKEARSKYVKNASAQDERKSDAGKPIPMMSYVKDIVKMFNKQYGTSKPTLKPKFKTSPYLSRRNLPENIEARNGLLQDTQLFEDDEMDPEPPSATENLLANWDGIRSPETEARFVQIMSFVAEMKDKLDKIDKNVTKLTNANRHVL